MAPRPERALLRFAYVGAYVTLATRTIGTAMRPAPAGRRHGGNVLLCTSARKQSPTDMVVNLGDFEVWSTTGQADICEFLPSRRQLSC